MCLRLSITQFLMQWSAKVQLQNATFGFMVRTKGFACACLNSLSSFFSALASFKQFSQQSDQHALREYVNELSKCSFVPSLKTQLYDNMIIKVFKQSFFMNFRRQLFSAFFSLLMIWRYFSQARVCRNMVMNMKHTVEFMETVIHFYQQLKTFESQSNTGYSQEVLLLQLFLKAVR